MIKVLYKNKGREIVSFQYYVENIVLIQRQLHLILFTNNSHKFVLLCFLGSSGQCSKEISEKLPCILFSP